MFYAFQRLLQTPFGDAWGTEHLLVPIFMMTMCARGFILWIINVGLVICLGLAAAGKLNKQVRQNNYTISGDSHIIRFT
jgi:hypothetical protein